MSFQEDDVLQMYVEEAREHLSDIEENLVDRRDEIHLVQLARALQVVLVGLQRRAGATDRPPGGGTFRLHVGLLRHPG